MEMLLNLKSKEIISILKKGGVGVIPTDTLYGLVGSAFSKEAVEKIYKIKNRDTKKALIILISSFKDLEKFGINLKEDQAKFLKKIWPGKVSVILPCKNKEFKYLHRGTNSLAFRFPAKKSLLEILKKTVPLVAPSANPEGLKPAENIREAKKYFGPVRSREGSQRPSASNGIGTNVDFYLAGGSLKSEPSTLIEINKDGEVGVLRGILGQYDSKD